MGTRVALPPGCYGLKMEDGAKYNNRPGGSVVVEDYHASAINKSRNGILGIVSGTMTAAIGTKHGRRCQDCAFLAQAWSAECPRCGGITERE